MLEFLPVVVKSHYPAKTGKGSLGKAVPPPEHN